MQVEPNKQVHILSESDKALKLNISTTVPIICSASHSCRVLVEISTDNSEALLDICVLEFKPGLANQSKIVQIAAKKDFILDGSNLMKLKFNISLKYDPVDWDRHRLIPDVLVSFYINSFIHALTYSCFFASGHKDTPCEDAKSTIFGS